LTDLAVIVIAADEGMKPQTIESINHARDAGVNMIVAVNKMDKPGANLDLVRGQLAEQGLQPEEWGGSTVVVPVSAHTGLGIDTLLDMIILSTELMGLKAVADRPAVATVIESHLDPRLGPLSTVLVNAGTLHKGDYVVCAGTYGRVRALKDFRMKNVDEAGPSVPVQVVGLSGVSEGGDILQGVADAESAAAKAHEFELLKSTKSVRDFESASLDMLMSRIKSGSLKQLKIVLKCDSNGSLEALKNALAKLSTDETKVTFIHSGVGDVNDSDVLMAGTGQALLIAYNVGINPHARVTLGNSKIEFIDKKVIYHVLEKVEAIITGMVDLRYEEQELGVGTVKAIFYTGKDKLIVGLGVDSGKIENRAKVRVVRGDHKAGSGEVANLKSGPMDMNEIEAGNDCGISFKGDAKIEVGDRLEFYKMVARK
jgi:translation initiation factor IF-2